MMMNSPWIQWKKTEKEEFFFLLQKKRLKELWRKKKKNPFWSYHKLKKNPSIKKEKKNLIKFQFPKINLSFCLKTQKNTDYRHVNQRFQTSVSWWWWWKLRNKGNLSKQCKLFNTKISSGSESIKSKINGRGAMCMPTRSFTTIRPGLMLLRHNRDLTTIQEL